jgi:predicted DNA-binding transcriptional regulator YafY
MTTHHVVILCYLRPMAYARIYSRQSKIVEFLRNAKQPTAKDIVRYLEAQGELIDVRTVQRDIERISMDMDIEIKKCGSHPRHWYEIDSEPEERPVASTYLEYAMMTDIMRNELEQEKKHGKVIHLDYPVLTKGLNNIPLLLPAIRGRNKVRMVYHKFSGEVSERVVCPLYFKQFRKRWYLLARDTSDNMVKSFGLERIEQVERLAEKFRRRDGEDHDSLYANAIGLFASEEPPVTVRFWSEEYNANYVRSVPLHPSQVEVEHDADGSIFELTVVPNYEFYQAMLMMGDKVKVISPEAVREGMKEVISAMLKIYC